MRNLDWACFWKFILLDKFKTKENAHLFQVDSLLFNIYVVDNSYCCVYAELTTFQFLFFITLRQRRNLDPLVTINPGAIISTKNKSSKIITFWRVFFIVMPSPLTCGYPCLLTPWIGVLYRPFQCVTPPPQCNWISIHSLILFVPKISP